MATGLGLGIVQNIIGRPRRNPDRGKPGPGRGFPVHHGAAGEGPRKSQGAATCLDRNPTLTFWWSTHTPSTLEVIRRNLLNRGFQVLTATDVPSALAILRERPIDLVITDFRMPGQSGPRSGPARPREPRRCRGVDDHRVSLDPGGPWKPFASARRTIWPSPSPTDELLEAVHRALDKLKLKRLSQE